MADPMDRTWLRGLDVRVRDAEALDGITADIVVAYLTARGWVNTGKSDRAGAEVWRAAADPVSVVVPLRDFRDRKQRLVELINAVAYVEERGSLGVLIDLREAVR